MRSNIKGAYAERWRHARGCGRFFNALRDTTTDHFLATYRTGEPRPRSRERRWTCVVSFRNAQGGRIDRARPLRFVFDGKSYGGYVGDTLASALLANGVHLVGRSFKYHRPRGILAAGSEEPNALVTVTRDAARRTPNLRATQVELYDGLSAESQNRWPSLAFDIGRVNDRLSAFFPAGFYYKTFMWPRRAWKSLYEPVIRRAAGLGVAPTQPDPDRYLQRYAHCDVLVVGAGPAGIAAAVAAAQLGGRVMLCDESSEFGGSLLGDPGARIGAEAALDWLQRSVQALASNPRVTLLARTTAFGYFPHNFVALNERLTDHLALPAAHQPRERLWHVRARRVVLATGAIERPLVFPGNDRPGIMLAGAAQTYLNRYGVRVADRVVVVTACDAAYQAALDLRAAGVAVAAVADLRAAPSGALPEAARRAGITVLPGSTVLGTEGDLRVRAIALGEAAARRARFDCDAVLMSGGFTPSVHLFSQSRGKLIWNEALQAFTPGQSAERERSAGACRGISELALAVTDGAAAGADARAARPIPEARPLVDCAAARLALRAGDRRESLRRLAERCHHSRLELAAREGFQSIEHVKRYTTTGMATDQGKTSNLNALAIVAAGLKCRYRRSASRPFACPTRP